MESADSPWGDMVRTVTWRHTCSRCSWDNSTSTLPAVGEATSMICSGEGTQEGAGTLSHQGRTQQQQLALQWAGCPSAFRMPAHNASSLTASVLSLFSNLSPAAKAHALTQSAIQCPNARDWTSVGWAQETRPTPRLGPQV